MPLSPEAQKANVAARDAAKIELARTIKEKKSMLAPAFGVEEDKLTDKVIAEIATDWVDNEKFTINGKEFKYESFKFFPRQHILCRPAEILSEEVDEAKKKQEKGSKIGKVFSWLFSDFGGLFSRLFELIGWLFTGFSQDKAPASLKATFVKEASDQIVGGFSSRMQQEAAKDPEMKKIPVTAETLTQIRQSIADAANGKSPPPLTVESLALALKDIKSPPAAANDPSKDGPITQLTGDVNNRVALAVDTVSAKIINDLPVDAQEKLKLLKEKISESAKNIILANQQMFKDKKSLDPKDAETLANQYIKDLFENKANESIKKTFLEIGKGMDETTIKLMMAGTIKQKFQDNSKLLIEAVNGKELIQLPEEKARENQVRLEAAKKSKEARRAQVKTKVAEAIKEVSKKMPSTDTMMNDITASIKAAIDRKYSSNPDDFHGDNVVKRNVQATWNSLWKKVGVIDDNPSLPDWANDRLPTKDDRKWLANFMHDNIPKITEIVINDAIDHDEKSISKEQLAERVKRRFGAALYAATKTDNKRWNERVDMVADDVEQKLLKQLGEKGVMENINLGLTTANGIDSTQASTEKPLGRADLGEMKSPITYGNIALPTNISYSPT